MSIFRRAISYYFQSFVGFSAQAWWLALVTLVNRAGAMVIPFLSLYLAADLGFTLERVGWVMTSFGAGSLVGAWIGGKLTDQLGFYKIMVFSLALSGFTLFIMSFFENYWLILVGVFFFTLTSDAFRPPAYVAIAAYSRPANRTRAITLVRLAINLGFSIGPALGGWIISGMGYRLLFWVDGATCAIAALLIWVLLSPKRQVSHDVSNTHGTAGIPAAKQEVPYKDYRYLVFLVGLFLFAAMFFQYFSVMPVYYKVHWSLSEGEIGLLMAVNGLLIFFFEMPLIYALDDRSRFSRFFILLVAAFLLGGGFLILNFSNWTGILVIGMTLATLAEMLCFPFANAVAMERGAKGHTGMYMAYFQVAFSLAHLVGHNMGMRFSGRYDYPTVMYLFTIGSVVSAIVFWGVRKKVL